MSSPPAGRAALDLERERELIQRGLTLAIGGDRLRVEVVSGATPVDAAESIDLHDPGVVQFSGHGAPDALQLETADGHPRALPRDDFVETLRRFGSSVRLVVLNACDTWEYAEALLRHVECVIAMRGPIQDSDAIQFAAELYKRLAAGDSVEDAYRKARLMMRLHHSSGSTTREIHAPSFEPAPAVEARDPTRLFQRYAGSATEVFVVSRRG